MSYSHPFAQTLGKDRTKRLTALAEQFDLPENLILAIGLECLSLYYQEQENKPLSFNRIVELFQLYYEHGLQLKYIVDDRYKAYKGLLLSYLVGTKHNWIFKVLSLRKTKESTETLKQIKKAKAEGATYREIQEQFGIKELKARRLHKGYKLKYGQILQLANNQGARLILAAYTLTTIGGYKIEYLYLATGETVINYYLEDTFICQDKTENIVTNSQSIAKLLKQALVFDTTTKSVVCSQKIRKTLSSNDTTWIVKLTPILIPVDICTRFVKNAFKKYLSFTAEISRLNQSNT